MLFISSIVLFAPALADGCLKIECKQHTNTGNINPHINDCNVPVIANKIKIAKQYDPLNVGWSISFPFITIAPCTKNK